jgi:hypothetical protein
MAIHDSFTHALPISAMFGCTTSGGGTWSCGRSAARLAAARDRCSNPRGGRSAPGSSRQQASRRAPPGGRRARGDLRSAASRARVHVPSVCAPELLEQSSRLDQVGRVESLREPRVDFRHQRVGLGCLALSRPYPAEARRRAQLEGFRPLSPRDRDGLAEEASAAFSSASRVSVPLTRWSSAVQ